jgi:L-ascorbate metabolism protein UlaG (beta-lactamase superfamily)
MSNPLPVPVSVQLIGGPTAVIEIGGVRLLTDPTFDPPRTIEESGVPVVTKFRGPALLPGQLGSIDAVLLSHDLHPDNLDDAGRAYLAGAATVLTTLDGARRLGGTARGLAPWDSVTLPMPGGGPLEITALPAQHGPGPDAELTSGPVIGFLLRPPGGPAVYVSGDNASLAVVAQIVERAGSPEISVLFTGGASLPFLFGGDFVTLTARQAAEAAQLLGSRAVIPVHLNGWSHYTDDEQSVAAAFQARHAADRLRLLQPGELVTV